MPHTRQQLRAQRRQCIFFPLVRVVLGAVFPALISSREQLKNVKVPCCCCFHFSTVSFFFPPSFSSTCMHTAVKPVSQSHNTKLFGAFVEQSNFRSALNFSALTCVQTTPRTRTNSNAMKRKELTFYFYFLCSTERLMLDRSSQNRQYYLIILLFSPFARGNENGYEKLCRPKKKESEIILHIKKLFHYYQTHRVEERRDVVEQWNAFLSNFGLSTNFELPCKQWEKQNLLAQRRIYSRNNELGRDKSELCRRRKVVCGREGKVHFPVKIKNNWAQNSHSRKQKTNNSHWQWRWDKLSTLVSTTTPWRAKIITINSIKTPNIALLQFWTFAARASGASEEFKCLELISSFDSLYILRCWSRTAALVVGGLNSRFFLIHADLWSLTSTQNDGLCTLWGFVCYFS